VTDAVRGKQKDTKEQRFREVLTSITRTARGKGWYFDILNEDHESWKYATLKVRRLYGAFRVEGILDLTVDDEIAIQIQPTSGHNLGVQELLDAMFADLQHLGWIDRNSKKVEVPNVRPPERPASETHLMRVERVLRGFHEVSRQLQHRPQGRAPLLIRDEYDVQYLLGALLRLYFPDVRSEEYTPSYAGGSSRIDFLLKKEKIVIETKFATATLRDNKIGEQLMIDIQRYQTHQDCKTLVCFIYDPTGCLKNPAGLVDDLSKDYGGLLVKVVITP
jgi:hypothetical protein